jgi:hypothetical protein
MSTGERSCIQFGKCEFEGLYCTVDCKGYEWDKKTKPDTKHFQSAVDRLTTKMNKE